MEGRPRIISQLIGSAAPDDEAVGNLKSSEITAAARAKEELFFSNPT